MHPVRGRGLIVDEPGFAPALRAIAARAGAAILEVYARAGLAVATKGDGSPLTEADLAAHQVISEGLAALSPLLPLLSEESAGIPYGERRTWARHWLVDPLDGTKEFLARNGEFTVNIALVEDGIAVFGVVQQPVTGACWWGGPAYGAWRSAGPGAPALRLAVRQRAAGSPWRAVSSRSHAGPATESWLAAVAADGGCERLPFGSSLKICRIADGAADLYPRFAPTSLWDTAAAHAVLRGAGGRIIDRSGDELAYGGESQLNPWFLALGAADPADVPPFPAE